MVTATAEPTKPKTQTRLKFNVLDEPGQFRRIDKNELAIDDSYQREASQQKINAIASNWSWMACGAIHVAERDGDFYVFDGGHRVLAARKRRDIDELPCLVFGSEGTIGEARGFLSVNTLRRPLKALERFKAQLVVGDKAALLVDELMREHSYRPADTSHPGKVVKCVSTLYLYSQRSPDLFRRMFPLIVAVCEGDTILEKIVKSLMYIQERLEENGSCHSLLAYPWDKKVVSVGRLGIIRACDKAASAYSTGGPKVWAFGVVGALNHRMRTQLDLEINLGSLF
jgi:hypothetical protein